MDHSSRTTLATHRVTAVSRLRRDRKLVGLRPECEILEGRQLLSKTIPAAHADMLAPPPVQVANATAELASQAGPQFQQLSGDLQRAEATSKVTPAQYARLEGDVRQIDHAIESANLSSSQITKQVDQLQDTIDASFLGAGYGPSDWKKLQQQMASALNGLYGTNALNTIQRLAVLPLPIASNTTISSTLVHNTFSLMRTIAREAHVSLADHSVIVADEKAVAAALGPNPNTNIGGGTPRNPLVVYYDGQAANFVNKR